MLHPKGKFPHVTFHALLPYEIAKARKPETTTINLKYYENEKQLNEESGSNHRGDSFAGRVGGERQGNQALRLLSKQPWRVRHI